MEALRRHTVPKLVSKLNSNTTDTQTPAVNSPERTHTRQQVMKRINDG
jgi:hypothetical protein